MNPCPYRPKLKRERKLFILFAILAIMTPTLACVEFIRPPKENFAIWFQRSGSAMVVLALLAEMRAYQMLEVFKVTSSFVGDTFYQTQDDYLWQAKFANIFSFMLIAIATVIWGYGDLLIKHLTNQ